MWKNPTSLNKNIGYALLPINPNRLQFLCKFSLCVSRASPGNKKTKGHETLFKALQKFSENAPLLLSLTTLFWAGNFIIGRGMHETLPPLAMATLRWSLAALIFLPFSVGYLKKDFPEIRRNFGTLLLLGGLGVGMFNSLAYIGLNHTTALNGVIIQSVGPILIILTAYLLFGERIGISRMVAVGISLCGVLVIISKGEIERLAGLRLNSGDLFVLGAMTIWALYTVLLRLRPNIHPVSFIAVTFIIGATLNIPFFVWEHFFVRAFQASPQNLLAIAYVAVFPSILSYLFWNRGVALIGSARAGSFLHLVPLYGSLMAMAFLGEQPALFHLVGFGLILTGVILASRS